MATQPAIPVNVVHLLPVLDAKLIDLLRSLDTDDWQKQTVAKIWKVKDVVAHLLDINIRVISSESDHIAEPPPQISSTAELVTYLNQLNADWVTAMKRVSPEALILLHEMTGPLFCDHYASLDLMGTARYAVDWAGESQSRNWMHIAREYTEKFLHQQQIRDAVNMPGLMTRELFYPFIDIFMMGLPHTYRDVVADNGKIICVTVTGDIGGSWYLVREADKWKLNKDVTEKPSAELSIDPDTAWKLFSKSLRPEQVRHQITLKGDLALAETALNMVSVMA